MRVEFVSRSVPGWATSRVQMLPKLVAIFEGVPLPLTVTWSGSLRSARRDGCTERSATTGTGGDDVELDVVAKSNQHGWALFMGGAMIPRNTMRRDLRPQRPGLRIAVSVSAQPGPGGLRPHAQCGRERRV